VAIEDWFGAPVDVEFAGDRSGALTIVQVRALSSSATRRVGRPRLRGEPAEAGEVLAAGLAVGMRRGESAATGPVRVLADPAAVDDLHVLDGAVLVAPHTDPAWMTLLRGCAAVVTDVGGATSHAAIVSRELGIPAV